VKTSKFKNRKKIPAPQKINFAAFPKKQISAPSATIYRIPKIDCIEAGTCAAKLPRMRSAKTATKFPFISTHITHAARAMVF
jgi:hypothetical protein